MVDESGCAAQHEHGDDGSASGDGWALYRHGPYGQDANAGPRWKDVGLGIQGMAVEGYDNVKKKFVSSWIDNMGTAIMISEGTYDAGAKTLTYTAETEMMPGMKTKM